MIGSTIRHISHNRNSIIRHFLVIQCVLLLTAGVVHANGGPSAADLHAEGLKHYQSGDYDKAAASWLKEFEIAKGNANTANNIGIAYRAMGAPQKAIEYHQKSIELNPSFAKAY